MRWVDYWNGDSPVYVNSRHKLLHYQGIARDILAVVGQVAQGGLGGARVLDYGCGEALSAMTVARGVRRLTLCDAAPAVRERLSYRYADHANIEVLSPEQVVALPGGLFDVIIVNSMIQYISKPEFQDLLGQWRRALAPGGVLVIADVIPPDVSAARDAQALLGFGWRGGFLVAAGFGLVRTALSDYRKLRDTLGITRYGEGEMLASLAEAGFVAERRRPNLGHNQSRMTFLARAA